MNQTYRWLVRISLAAVLLFSCQAINSIQATPTIPAPALLSTTPESINTDSPVRDLPQSTELPTAPDLVEEQDLLVSMYDLVNPGVVSIRVSTQDGQALGSGFVYDNEGHIITNYHVIEGVTHTEVDFPSGFKVEGEVIGTDLDSDLALIVVDAPAEELHPLNLGDSANLKVGQTVAAIGNPFGLDGTMTTGIVSGLGRTLESFRQAPGGGGTFSAGDLIQTDTAINPGNSGGPLLNMNGEVIGISRAIRTLNFTTEAEPLNSGIGFAIPINIVKRVIPALLSEGQYDYPYLGISSDDGVIDLVEQEILNLPQSTGAYVNTVTQGGPADQAGLRGGTTPTEIPGLNAGGDLIIAIDGQPVLTFSELLSYLINNKSPGDTILLTVLRDNQELEIELVLDKRP